MIEKMQKGGQGEMCKTQRKMCGDGRQNRDGEGGESRLTEMR